MGITDSVLKNTNGLELLTNKLRNKQADVLSAFVQVSLCCLCCLNRLWNQQCRPLL